MITDSYGIHFRIRDRLALDRHSRKLLDHFFNSFSFSSYTNQACQVKRSLTLEPAIIKWLGFHDWKKIYVTPDRDKISRFQIKMLPGLTRLPL